MNRDTHFLLNYLDQPWRLLFLTVDEVLILAFPLVLGFWHFEAFWGLAGAGVGFSGARFLKKRFGKGNFPAALYWHLPTSRRHMALFLPSHVREFIG